MIRCDYMERIYNWCRKGEIRYGEGMVLVREAKTVKGTF